MLVVPSIGETRVARRAYIVHAIGAGTCLRLNPKPRRLLLHPHPNDGRLAPGPPTSSVVIAAGPVDGRHLVRGVLLQAARHFPRGLQDNLHSAMQASPASRQDVFWTAVPDDK